MDPTIDSCDLGPFLLTSGERIDALRIGYRMWGERVSSPSNLLLCLPGTTVLSGWADTYVGPDLAFDPSRYLIVSMDPIGGGKSSKPSDGLGPEFPRYSVEDSIAAQALFLETAFSISAPAAVVGLSIGGMMALDWGRRGAGRVVAWIAGYRHPGSTRAMVDAFARIVCLDPVFAGGSYAKQPEAGLRAAASAYLPLLYGPDYLTRLTGDELSEAGSAMARSWLTNWDANDLLSRYRSSIAYDFTRAYGGNLAQAAAAVGCPVLLMPSSTDQLEPLAGVTELAKALPNANLAPVETDLGHFAPLAGRGSSEHRQFCDKTARFLNA